MHNTGGGDSELLLPVQHTDIAGGNQQVTVSVSGLKGGHSGGLVDVSSDKYAIMLLLLCRCILHMRRHMVMCRSGLNINDGRANANRLLATTVAAILTANPDAQLLSIKGGDKRNALAREASAVLAVSADRCGTVSSCLRCQAVCNDL